MALAILVLAALLVIILAVLFALKPTKLRLSLVLTKWFHFELETETSGSPGRSARPR